MTQRRWQKTLSWILASVFLLLWGCGGKSPQEILRPPPIPEQRRLPVDYLFVIDNSGSIPEEQRGFVREVIQLFVEMTDPADRVALLAFDEEERLLAKRTIQGQQDRDFIKAQAEAGLSFKGNYTDISRPFLYAASHRAELFRGAGHSPVMILMSDGKLEPKRPRSTDEAYRDILATTRNQLSGIPIYAIGLGDKEIHQEFLPGVNGLRLLQEHLAGPTTRRFYPIHAVNGLLDPYQLLDTYFQILRVTKGRSGVPGKTIFQVDESAQRISAIVMKRNATQEICATGDISLQDPKGQRINYPNHQGFYGAQKQSTRVRWQSRPYYDLITVEQPFPGEWRIGLAGGKEPQVVSLLQSFIYLRYQVRESYWANEEKQVTAWLYDERTGAVSPLPCRIKARFDRAERFPKSLHDIPFQAAGGGLHLAALRGAEGPPSLAPGDYRIQLRAQNEGKSFYRLGDPLSLRIQEPFLTFSVPPARVIRRPWGKGVSFQGVIDTRHRHYPAFQEEPRLSLSLERIDEEGRRSPLPVIALPGRAEEGRIGYLATLAGLEPAGYMGQYTLKGVLKNGEMVEIRSESFGFRVEKWWVYGLLLLLAIVLLLGLILWVLLWRTDWGHPRLVGQLSITLPSDVRPNRIDLRGERNKKAMKWGRGGEHLELGSGRRVFQGLQQVAFRLEARREGGKKRVRLKVLGGAIVKVNGQSLTSTDLFHQDVISFTDGGRGYQVSFHAPRLQRAKPGSKKRR